MKTQDNTNCSQDGPGLLRAPGKAWFVPVCCVPQTGAKRSRSNADCTLKVLQWDADPGRELLLTWKGLFSLLSPFMAHLCPTLTVWTCGSVSSANSRQRHCSIPLFSSCYLVPSTLLSCVLKVKCRPGCLRKELQQDTTGTHSSLFYLFLHLTDR